MLNYYLNVGKFFNVIFSKNIESKVLINDGEMWK